MTKKKSSIGECEEFILFTLGGVSAGLLIAWAIIEIYVSVIL